MAAAAVGAVVVGLMWVPTHQKWGVTANDTATTQPTSSAAGSTLPDWVATAAHDVAVSASGSDPTKGWPSSLESVKVVEMSGSEFDEARGASGVTPPETRLYVVVMEGSFPSQRGAPSSGADTSAAAKPDAFAWVALDPEWKQPRGFWAGHEALEVPAGTTVSQLYP